MTFRLGHLVAAVGLTLALVSCGAPPTAPPTGSGSADGASKFQQYEGAEGPGAARRLVKDAKAEGELSLYTSMTERRRRVPSPRRSPTRPASRSTCTGPTRRPSCSASCRRPGPTTQAPTWSRRMRWRWMRSATSSWRSRTRANVATWSATRASSRTGPPTRYNLFAPSWNTTKVAAGDQPKSVGGPGRSEVGRRSWRWNCTTTTGT